MPIALMVGGLGGAVNGFLITRLRISAFIVTLAMLYVIRGVGLSLYSHDVKDLSGAVIDDDQFLILGQGDILGVPLSFVIFAVMLIVGTLVLRRTRFGLYLYAVGGSELAARLTRIDVRRVQLSTYVIAGFCSALAGVILASRLQTGAPEAGLGEEFDVIAAAIIGGASLFGGRGTFFGTLLGAAFITVLRQGPDADRHSGQLPVLHPRHRHSHRGRPRCPHQVGSRSLRSSPWARIIDGLRQTQRHDLPQLPGPEIAQGPRRPLAGARFGTSTSPAPMTSPFLLRQTPPGKKSTTRRGATTASRPGWPTSSPRELNPGNSALIATLMFRPRQSPSCLVWIPGRVPSRGSFVTFSRNETLNLSGSAW